MFLIIAFIPLLVVTKHFFIISNYTINIHSSNRKLDQVQGIFQKYHIKTRIDRTFEREGNIVVVTVDCV